MDGDRYTLKQGKEVWYKSRINWHLVEGDDVPPPMFKNTKPIDKHNAMYYQNYIRKKRAQFVIIVYKK
jgi:hypothetical protein